MYVTWYVWVRNLVSHWGRAQIRSIWEQVAEERILRAWRMYWITKLIDWLIDWLIVCFARYYCRDQDKQTEIGEACSTNRGDKAIKIFSTNIWKKPHTFTQVNKTKNFVWQQEIKSNPLATVQWRSTILRRQQKASAIHGGWIFLHMLRRIGGRKVSSTHSSTRLFIQVSGQVHAPVALTLKKKPRVIQTGSSYDESSAIQKHHHIFECNFCL